MSVPDSDDLATRLAAVERRLQQVEDELALHRQLAGYGPAVDAGDAGAAADLWTEDGLYDIGGHGLLQGRDDLREIVDNPVHRSLLEAGCAHVV
ncbi:MAG: nuclear transport factor 2 family protein, partial [Acidimicrobiales bacterium]|nr:nuclear transport factor 2 family protein [Acidimicrobiales bacterium]